MNKVEIYEQMIKKFDKFFEKYQNLSFQAKLATLNSVLKSSIDDLIFVGFYLVVNHQDQQVLEIGAYQSHVLATPRINYGNGVCGETWEKGNTIIVSDVSVCKNYIACDQETKSEIVIPIWDNKNDFGNKQKIVGVWDIDSGTISKFDQTDQMYLEKICKYLQC